MTHRLRNLILALIALACVPAMSRAQFGGIVGGYGGRVQPENGGGEGNGPPHGHQHHGPPPSTQPTTRPNEDAAVLAAEQKLGAVVDKLKATFEASDDFKKSLDALDQAQSNYDDAVQGQNNTLSSNADYQAAVSKRTAAEDAVQQGRANGADDATMAQLAKDAMDARTAVSKLQKQISANDPSVKDAQDKLTAAGAAVQQMRDQFQDSLKDNPDWQAAKKALDDAVAKSQSHSS